MIASKTGSAETQAAGNRLLAWAARTRAFRSRWQRPLLLIALVAVIAGCVISFVGLDLRWSDLRPLPLLVIAVVVVPLSVAYSALNMMLMGRAARVPMSFAEGVKTSVFAQVAEILPIPGGAIVRGAALMRAGSSTGTSAELVIAFSLLWIACGATGAGIALREVGVPAQMLAFGGSGGALSVCLWLGARFGGTVAVTALLLRVAGVLLVAWRFVLAFAVLGVGMAWFDAMAFGFAAILGSAASLIPAGLGVSEALSALIAQPAGVAPAAAFLAASLSRLIGFTGNLLLALAYTMAGKAPTRTATPTRHQAD